ncbi:protein PELPK1 isoform X5 [Drosophila yakuba]|uniref:Uncharacterized protein, isoform C n=1 Tax=Drosophila yakuba TaxID=7245 RepID=A0A0R1DR94_DROYA|nr:protein PELPK1 isoform X5 [Drosophila yakuba]KRJ99692.1 uncharacterized protein Dyak_GE12222, isoform C [Drosophila yakuba]
MRILWIAAISVSWQFSDAHFFMPNFLCIPPFVAINGSCLIPPITKPLIPPCLKNPQNLNLFPENRKIVTVSPWNFLPEDDDSIGKNISEDKEPSLPIKVPVKPITQNSPSAGAVEGGNKHQRLKPSVPANKLPIETSVNPSNPEPKETIIRKPEESNQNKSNPGQVPNESKHPEKGSNTGSKLKPIPGTRPGNPSMNPKISQTHELGIGILPSKKPTKIPLPPALPSDLRLPKDPSMPDTVPVTDLTIPDADKLTDGILPSIDLPRDLLTPEVPSNPKEISKIEPTNPIIPDTDEIINRLLPSERPNQIQLPGITGVGSGTQLIDPTLPGTDNSEDLLKPPGIPPLEMPGSNQQIHPKIPKTDHLINGELPSADLIAKPDPPKINLPGMPKIIDPKIPKMIRPEDLYPKEINIYQLLPKDIFY